MGYMFNHPIGLAAGFDKNGRYLAALRKLGFSFIEIGTVTPKAQQGNPKPRIFRLPRHNALINRMGFNNDGVEAVVNRIKHSAFKGILGINIGKNKDTSLNQAVEDYLFCLRKVYPYASYVTINISSPNTQDLRQLQKSEFCSALLSELREEQLQLTDKWKRYVPLAIKLSPDEDNQSLQNIANTVLSLGLDAIIATNTTINRPGMNLSHSIEGGLSGAPLMDRGTECIKVIKEVVGEDVTLIASGGILKASDVQKKLDAGASLVQIYTGLIYQGPYIVHNIMKDKL